MTEIRELLEAARKEREALAWEGTFEEYLNMAIANPHLARHSHARIYDMIQWAGTTSGVDGVAEYKLFAGEIFGLDVAIDRMAQYFNAAARGLEVRKRILLLMGPPASGKSSIVNLLKGGLERYSRTDQGAVYAIKGCPMQEEPLHLIPEERRQEMARDYGLRIEGDLCPRCRYNLRNEYDGDMARVKVSRINYDQSAGVGMGSFVATSAESQDLARLVGSVDLARLADDRVEGAGKGLRLDGELQAANRGIMEFIEIFKSDERFLAVMLGVTQEQVIKLGSFGSVYADEAIIAHSNEEEYNAFVNNKETAALLDRLILVKIPYNLRVNDEVKIYEKMLPAGGGSESGQPEPHPGRAPLALHVAALLAVLSRLENPERGSGHLRVAPLDKMKLYDGRILPPYSRADLERLQEESPREGMFGLSPRYVINRLADVITREQGCLTPLKALESLVDGLVERAGVDAAERIRILSLVQEALKEYKELAVREVQRAGLEDFLERASQLFRSYILDAERFCAVQNLGAGSGSSPGEGVLRRVENAVNLRDAERTRFRQEVCQTYRYMEERQDPSGSRPSGRSLAGAGYSAIPVLKLGIENILFPSRDAVKAMIDPRRKDPKRREARESILQRLISDHGYCEECAGDLMYFAWRTLQGKEVMSIKRGTISWE